MDNKILFQLSRPQPEFYSLPDFSSQKKRREEEQAVMSLRRRGVRAFTPMHGATLAVAVAVACSKTRKHPLSSAPSTLVSLGATAMSCCSSSSSRALTPT
ncbi:hypothetical protein BDA96_09G271300 [Sorghum bicolor]|uniref:Uncharacterized protein n=1 Tax=Sorghum bicolor TaxID=4558 RepID=A0A921U6F5_SORBI|nr:hypothetical protein BDA96_09G271300 [Sorghum bicolor]